MSNEMISTKPLRRKRRLKKKVKKVIYATFGISAAIAYFCFARSLFSGNTYEEIVIQQTPEVSSDNQDVIVISDDITEEEKVQQERKDYTLLDKNDGECLLIPTDAIKSIENNARTFNSVKVRTSPTTDSEYVTILEKNTPITVLENRTDGWSEIIMDNNIYYIYSYYIGGDEEYQTYLAEEAKKDHTPYNTELAETWGFSYNLQKYLWDSVCNYTTDDNTRQKYYCFILGVIQQESTFGKRVSNYNSNGTRDLGIMQVNSSNWSKLKKCGIISSYSLYDLTCDELLDPYTGIKAGMYFLNQYVNNYGISEAAYYQYNTGKKNSSGSNGNSRKVYNYYKTWLEKIYG